MNYLMAIWSWIKQTFVGVKNWVLDVFTKEPEEIYIPENYGADAGVSTKETHDHQNHAHH